MGANTIESSRMLGDDVTSKQFSGIYCFLVLVTFLVVAGCGTTQHSAPVVDYAAIDTQPSLDSTDSTLDEEGRFYVVQRGDTLYSIALDHGINLKELAEWNNITNPGAIQLGQRINLSVPSTQTQTSPQTQPLLIALPHQGFPADNTPAVEMPRPTSEMESVGNQVITEPKALVLPYSDQALVQLQGLAHPALIAPTPSISLPEVPTQTNVTATGLNTRIENAPEPQNTSINATLNRSNIDWMWPTEGKLLEGFSDKSKGVRISGVAGQPVLASAAGQVVYSGSGLRGYGKLLIIKHNNTYLSAYAHNSKILVQEGDTVTKGQKIAEMGNSDTDTVKLHFEIRKNGKPVDPLQFLPGKSG